MESPAGINTNVTDMEFSQALNTRNAMLDASAAERYVTYLYSRPSYELRRDLPGTHPYHESRPTPHAHTNISSGTDAWRLDTGPQTVEQLVDQGYFMVPKSEPETAILDDRRLTSWLGLDDVIGQLKQRSEIYKKHMLELKWAECYAFNELARGGWPPTTDQYTVHEKRMQDLGEQQRTERLRFWQDTSRLRQTMPESVQQYLSAHRTSEILRGDDA